MADFTKLTLAQSGEQVIINLDLVVMVRRFGSVAKKTR
jgi:hypothetical protein